MELRIHTHGRLSGQSSPFIAAGPVNRASYHGASTESRRLDLAAIVLGVVLLMMAPARMPGPKLHASPLPPPESRTDTRLQSVAEIELPHASDLMEIGLESFQRGAFEQAVIDWKEAVRLYDQANHREGMIDARMNLAAAYQALGLYKLAIGRNLNVALALAQKADDRQRIMRVKSSLGNACMFTRQATEAETLLSDALTMAREDGQHQAVAVILNNMGNLYAAQNKHAQALEAYRESHTLARDLGDTTLAAKAVTNAAAAAARADQADEAGRLLEQAQRTIAKLDPTHDKIYLLLTISRTAQQLVTQTGMPAEKLTQLMWDTGHDAVRTAEKIGDRRALSYALGQLGHAHEINGSEQEALELTARAAFVAQEVQSPHALYRWQWQTGRLLTRQGRLDDAIRAYTKAVETLQPIRHDIAIGYGNRNTRSSFRQAVGPIFYELADLLIQRAKVADDGQTAQRYLLAAQQTVEQLKSAQLEDYFQDDCVNLIKARITDVAEADPRTAVIYVIPLPDRTEILVTLPSGLTRFVSPVDSSQLVKEVRQFRQKLETRTTHRYMKHARRLHAWLIAPIHTALVSAQIDTLVFVPDGALGTIPMAALHDGHEFLVHRYAVAVTPGLTLMDLKPIERAKIRMLMTGLSESVQGYPALEHVPSELDELANLFAGKRLMNDQFRTSVVEKEVQEHLYSVVHIASHGEFSPDAAKTFLLTYDGKLTLDDLETLIRPIQYRAQPLELLTLSACQTAAGDDRAALGLAGVAIKAGARSALATLWFVNDQASADVVAEIYRQLDDNPMLSKAKAVQIAQKKLLADQRYRHPCYWSPYLIIGNWL